MVIIFFEPKTNKLFICSENSPMKILDRTDSSIMNYIPNDDILYVETGHYFTKEQFNDLINNKIAVQPAVDVDEELEWIGQRKPVKRFDGLSSEKQVNKTKKNRIYIHPTSNGTIRLEDIKTNKYPNGIELRGKWDFIATDDIGEDVLDESLHYKFALAKGRIERVDEEFYQTNKHKKNLNKISPAAAALDKILVPVGIKAEAAASAGGIGNTDDDNDVIEIEVN